MLLTELILAKRGPLAKVWLSAHHERKLSKQQALGVDVGESVDAILTQEVEPMTLRISGQLMLGVVRIYGRKVQYLMDDCRDTRERISMAFRPGMVDLPEDQIRANRNAITFTEIGNNIDSIDLLDWNFAPVINDLPSGPRGLHTVPLTQTSLRSREYGAFNFGRPTAPSIYGDDQSSRQGSHDDATSHLDSQDFQPYDLGLGLDDMDMGLDFDMSMEVGRDAMRERSKSAVPLRSPSVLHDLLEDHGMDIDNHDTFEPIELDLGLDDLPELEERQRRETSALSTPPPESPPLVNTTIDVTPRTAKRIADAQQAQPKPKRVRVVRADEELELADEEFAPPTEEDSNILGEERFIPADPEAVRLRDIIDDPAKHFLPTVKVGADSFIFAGPAGLAPELADLFLFNTNVLRRARDEPEEDDHAAKRLRTATVEAEDEDEVGRRQSRLPSEVDFDAGMDNTFDGGFDAGNFDGGDMGDMSFGFDDLKTPPARIRDPSLAPSRAESVARAIQFGDEGDNALACFDTRTSTQAQTQTQDPSLDATQPEATGGFSKTTGMAMGVLRREIEAIEAEDKAVQFDKVAAGASKRAASAFFFELLVLGTRDAVKLEQEKAYGPIEVRAKEKLFATA